MKELAEWWDNYDRARTLLDNLEPCFSAGFSSDECGDAVWAGACTMYLELGVEAAPEFRLLGLPFEEICKGEPRLKCCKYEPATDVGCHTAFNDPAPINCEGNWTTPNAESYGPCLWDGDPLHIGCTCCAIAECFTPACDPATLASPISGAWRDGYLREEARRLLQERGRAGSRRSPEVRHPRRLHGPPRRDGAARALRPS